MKNNKIDLSDIKDNDLDKTSSFTDLMSRSERRKRKMEKDSFIENKVKTNDNLNDIEEMINEKKKSTADLTKELEKAKKEYNKDYINQEKNEEENLGKTQILELTRQMKFNFEETKEENNIKKKNGISFLNVIGILNLLCIGFYIYLLTFTNYQDNPNNYLITGGIIVLLVLLFGLSVISGRKARKVFNIFNFLTILAFIAFNVYLLLY
ncbi:MAG: hypothetical protein IJY25_01285 [Bacilli bacterium]|nr:hypothetical protein [Bacilli bacterium]